MHVPGRVEPVLRDVEVSGLWVLQSVHVPGRVEPVLRDVEVSVGVALQWWFMAYVCCLPDNVALLQQ